MHNYFMALPNPGIWKAWLASERPRKVLDWLFRLLHLLIAFSAIRGGLR
jgi:hypothetical protein